MIDLYPLNEFVRQTPFKMETTASVLLSVRKGDFLASVDLKDAYFQIPIHHSSRKLLRFVTDRTVHQFKVLCFGLSTASQVFTRVFATVSAWAHSRGVRLLRYLDDWLVVASSETRAKQHVRDLLSLCHSLGIVINEEKSDLNPSQSVEYLGMSIDTMVARAFPTVARVERFLSIARRFLLRQNPSAQLWQVLLGHMSSLEKLVPHGRLRMRSIQWHLKSHWSPERDPPHLPVPRSRQVEEDLSWWMVRDHLLKGMNSGSPPLLRRVTVGMGSSPPRSISVGNMVGTGELVTHQSPRDESSVPSHKVVRRHCHQPSSDSDVRQFDGRSLCQQAGGHSLRLPLLVDRATSLMDRVPRCPSGSEVPARAIQCPGRSPQPSESSAGCRMVPPSAGGKETDPNLGVPVAGLVRDTSQREAAPVLLPNPGPPGRLRGCLPSPLERPRCVRISSFPPGRESRGPSQRDPKSLDDPGRPSLARESVVRRPSPPPDPTTSATPPVGPTATPAALHTVPWRHPRPELSRMATLKRLLRKSGFSRRAALEMSVCVRESTARLCQSQWLSFCGWRRGRGVAPIDATIPLIVDFLIHLRVDKGFSLSALKGYRSTINSVMTLKGVDLATSRELSMFFRSSLKSCSPNDLRPPAWDVALVLQSLTDPPYEPLKTVEERSENPLPDSPWFRQASR